MIRRRRAGTARARRVLSGLCGVGLAIGACEPLDIALFPPPATVPELPVVDAGRPLPPDNDVVDAGNTPSPAPPDARSPSNPCLPGATACQACVLADNCPAGLVCHPLTGVCVVPCDDTSACPTPSVCNFLIGVCVGCIDESHCTRSNAPRCDTNRGVCVGCITSEDCSEDPERPVCLTGSQRCGCASNADCGAGFCEVLEAHCELSDD